jgi:hypothetical protein
MATHPVLSVQVAAAAETVFLVYRVLLDKVIREDLDKIRVLVVAAVPEVMDLTQITEAAALVHSGLMVIFMLVEEGEPGVPVTVLARLAATAEEVLVLGTRIHYKPAHQILEAAAVDLGPQMNHQLAQTVDPALLSFVIQIHFPLHHPQQVLQL